MTKFVRAVCVVMVLCVIMTIPAQAETIAEPRGSAFFAAYGASLYKTSSTSFQIWFDVDANAAIMDELGVYTIDLYRSADQQSWKKIKTYERDNYPEMIDTDSFSYAGYVTYSNAASGYYYYACVTFYAKDSRGVGMRDYYTYILEM